MLVIGEATVTYAGAKNGRNGVLLAERIRECLKLDTGSCASLFDSWQLQILA